MSEEEEEIFPRSRLPTTVRRGTGFENFVVQTLRQRGYIAARLCGSRPFDIVAFKLGEQLLIETKDGGKVGSKQLNHQKTMAHSVGVIYVTIERYEDKGIKVTRYPPTQEQEKK
jgi:hypothetical protein